MIDIAIFSITVVVNLFLGTLVAQSRAHPPLNKIFLLTIGSVILFAFSNFSIDTAASNEAALFALKLLITAGHFMVYSFFLFVFLFPDNRSNILVHPWHLISAAYVFFIVPILMWSDVVVMDVTIGPHGLESITTGPFNLYFFILWLLLALMVFTVLGYRVRKEANPKIAAQLKWILLGWSLFIVVSIIVGGILPFFYPAFVTISKIIPLFSIFMVGFTTYAIARYQFLHIRTVLQRSVIFTGLLIVIVALYLLLVFILGATLYEHTNISAILAGGFTAVVGVFAVPTIERWLKRKTDHIFFKNSYDFAEVVNVLADALHKNILLSDMVKEVTNIFEHYIKAESVVFTVFDERRKTSSSEAIVDDFGANVQVPIVYHHEQIGLVEFSEKRSGEPYTKRDLDLFRAFAKQSALAIEKAYLYEQSLMYARNLEAEVLKRTEKIRTLQNQQRQMVEDISHRLQDPITIAKTHLVNQQPLLLDNHSYHAFEKLLDDISEYTYKLMDLSTLQNVSDLYQKEKFSLSDLLLDLIEYYEVVAHEADIELRYDIESDLHIVGDKKRIEECISNVVSNAVKYNTRDIADKRIHITLHDAGNTALVTVSDTGIGIANDDLVRIFERFTRAAPQTEGFGIGLAIAKAIATQHRGTIAIDSEPGRGTTISIRLAKHS